MNTKTKLDFLQIKEVTTDKQKANGTRVFKLPVCDQYGAAIHVASYKTGYVRRVKAGGHCDMWQLNKTRTIPPTKDYKWPSIERILILDEQERLEYLIAFCLKNYYIKQSNMLSNGNFIPKWKHEHELDKAWSDGHAGNNDVSVIVNGQKYKVI